MTVGTCLRMAKALLRTGWTEPFSIDERGAAGVTPATSEKTCVADAIAWSCSTAAEGLEAFLLLESVACPNATAFNAIAMEPKPSPAHLEAWVHFAKRYDGLLDEWLGKPYRTIDQVLALFDKALVRTLKS